MAETQAEKELLADLAKAVAANDLDKTRLLFARAVSRVQKNDAGITGAMMATGLIRFAAECNAPDTTGYLIGQGADINVHQKMPGDKRSDQGSFLQHALYYAADKSAKVLIEAGADLRARDDDGDTPLHYALTYCRLPEVIALMLEKGADFYARNKDGDTPQDLLAREPEFKRLLDNHFRAAANFKKLKQHRPPSPFKKKP